MGNRTRVTFPPEVPLPRPCYPQPPWLSQPKSRAASTLTSLVDRLGLHARLRRFLWTLVPGAMLFAASARFNFFLHLGVALLMAMFVYLLFLFFRGVWQGMRGK